MTRAQEFTDWLKRMGCEVDVVQEDDGSGYTVLAVTTPELALFDVTVHEHE